jgi:hypothetical protein
LRIFSVISIVVKVVTAFIIRRRRGFSLPALLLLCFTGCGPAKPVLIYAPPSILLDSAGSPRRTAAINSGSHNFWEAMANLDTGFISKQSVTDIERDFARALGMVMSGRYEEAALALDGIRGTATDRTLVTASRLLMTAMLQYQDKWNLLAELDSMGKRTSGVDGAPDKAGVETWANAFRKVPARKIVFPSHPVVVPLILSAAATPMIEITIEGKPHVFWLDTGASMSIVSSGVAAELGMKPLAPDTLEVATTTGRVPAQAGAISHLVLGGIDVTHTTALIVDNDRMQVRIGGEAGLPSVAQIDGVIGYDIISRIDLRIDYVNRRVTMMKPVENAKLPRTGRNLFWVGTPVVRLVTSKGIPLHFNLDTGAQETYSTDGLLIKTKASTFLGERRLIGGLAGFTVVHGRFVGELRATMGGQPILLRKLMVFAPAFSSFVSLDGILGSDVGKSGMVRIDATNGLFLLEPPERRGLRGRS